MHLESATWSEMAEVAADVALLPVGSVEQHGPHAPLGTDCLTAEAVATRAAETGADGSDGGGEGRTRTAIVGPTIPVGIAAEHRAFEGTLWVSPDTFRAYLRETVESLIANGWTRVVIVNGHGGNAPACREVAAGVTRERDASVAAFTWFDAIDETDDMGHGGPIETSVVWAISPELIRTDRLESARDGGTARWGDWVAGVNLAIDSDEFTENGVVGDPTAASPERGEALLAAAATALSEVIEAMIDRGPDRTG